jgi:phospholipid transport system substrate-binding protein
MRILLAFFMVCVSVLPVFGEDAELAKINDPNDANAPLRILELKWGQAVAVLSDEDLKTEEKQKRIEKIVHPIFDFNLMAKLSLGKKNWPRLSKKEQAEFVTLFVQRLKDSYRDKVMLYTDEKAVFKPFIVKGITVTIPMELVGKDRTASVLYKFHKGKKGWSIYDVELEGVSILRSFRSQFNDILSRGTVEDLLCELRKPVEQQGG